MPRSAIPILELFLAWIHSFVSFIFKLSLSHDEMIKKIHCSLKQASTTREYTENHNLASRFLHVAILFNRSHIYGLTPPEYKISVVS